MLEAFEIENYRAFARRQSINIKPLTLFFGWNSGGKSALVRFLPFLAESIKAEGLPLWLAGQVGRNATWSDIVCKITERTSFKFSLKWQNPANLQISWEIAGDLGGRWQEAKSARIESDSQKLMFDRDHPEKSPWRGLLPDIFDKRLEILDVINSLANDVQWISGVRKAPDRIVNFSGGTPSTLAPNGYDSILHLIAESARGEETPILESVRNMFNALGEHLSLDNPLEGMWRVLLSPKDATQIKVNLCDTGEGYAQVLPILVALARSTIGGPKILCLEQPELHLHTRAQLELAKLLVETAKNSAQPKLLIETHSEVLLMSVQLAIAEKRISNEDVQIYWVETGSDGSSNAIPVSFSPEGFPNDTTMMTAFSEAITLGQRIASMQINNIAQ